MRAQEQRAWGCGISAHREEKDRKPLPLPLFQGVQATLFPTGRLRALTRVTKLFFPLTQGEWVSAAGGLLLLFNLQHMGVNKCASRRDTNLVLKVLTQYSWSQSLDMALGLWAPHFLSLPHTVQGFPAPSDNQAPCVGGGEFILFPQAGVGGIGHPALFLLDSATSCR